MSNELAEDENGVDDAVDGAAAPGELNSQAEVL